MPNVNTIRQKIKEELAFQAVDMLYLYFETHHAKEPLYSNSAVIMVGISRRGHNPFIRWSKMKEELVLRAEEGPEV